MKPTESQFEPPKETMTPEDMVEKEQYYLSKGKDKDGFYTGR
jgi:hypothetical protein